MFSTSENSASNYLATIVTVERISPHSNADKLQIVHIDGNSIITDLNTKVGDICLYFPLECAINAEYLSANNSFQDKTLNKYQEKSGFFTSSARVRAVRLRGQPSEGYLVPVETLSTWLAKPVTQEAMAAVGTRFDTVDGQLLCKKFIPKHANPKKGITTVKSKRDKHAFNKMIDGQFALHFDTAQLGRNLHKINPNTIISISGKYHGTSSVAANILCKKQLGWREKVAKFLGVNVDDKQYDMVYSSRRIIKNKEINPNAQHFYKTDIWYDVAKEIYPSLRKGETVYGEIVGYTKDGGAIQSMKRGDYDYGCKPNEHKFYAYRITVTNTDGVSFDLSFPQVKERCNQMGILHVPEYFYGYAKDLYPELDTEHFWHDNFLAKLQEDYLEKKCSICVNDVWDEGIVVRNESMNLESFKLKSFNFKMGETEQLDAGVLDLETEESLVEGEEVA